MVDTKIIFSISKLDVYEQNSFIKYIESVYFNSNTTLSQLGNIYVDLIRKNKIEEFDKTDIWKLTYPSKEYNDKKFRKLNSDLLKKLEDFIAQSEYDKSIFQPSLFKLKGIIAREMTRLYKVSAQATLRTIERNFHKAAEFYHAYYKNSELTYKILLQTEQDRSRFKDLLSVDAASNNLDIYYLSEKLRLYAVLLTWKRLYKVDKKIDYIEVLMKLANNKKYKDVAPIQMYLIIIKLIIKPDETEHFFEYKRRLRQFIHSFPKEEIYEIYEAGFNFCVARVNVGDSNFQEEAFKLYQEALEDGAIMKNDEISSAAFNNIIIFALRVGQYDWAETFVSEYAQYLREDIRDSTVAFSLARVEFYKKNYRQVIQHLIDVEYNSVVITLSSKVILLFSYFELDEIDPLDSLINSFRAYITREKSISPKRKASYSNLLNFTKKISRVNPNDQKKIKSIKQSLMETDNVASKPWLLEKIEELEK